MYPFYVYCTFLVKYLLFEFRIVYLFYGSRIKYLISPLKHMSWKGDPKRWLNCPEAKLVDLIHDLDHVVTLVTMEELYDPPQAWSRKEFIYSW